MKVRGISVLAGVVLSGALLTAQTPQQPAPASANPLTDQIRGYFDRVKGFLTKSIDMVPADKWTWAPTPDVRSFARMFGHITDDNNGGCWQLAGLPARPEGVDTPSNNESKAHKMSREELKKAYLDSFALCDKAFTMVNDQNMATPSVAGGRGTRLGQLAYNWSHINEHYGNLVTYLRLNNIVPPSSAGRGGF